MLSVSVTVLSSWSPVGKQRGDRCQERWREAEPCGHTYEAHAARGTAEPSGREAFPGKA